MKGISGWFEHQGFSTNLSTRHKDKHINWKEAYAILYALAKWGPQLQACTIIFMCDNETIVDALNKHTIKGEAIHILQLIYLAVALYDIGCLLAGCHLRETGLPMLSHALTYQS